MGLEFQIVTLQAVMAAQLDGTIHHALGIHPMQTTQDSSKDTVKHQAVAKKIVQWRWLIIDEISMVSARLLAEIDAKLRGML